jgi:hypothetical protein
MSQQVRIGFVAAVAAILAALALQHGFVAIPNAPLPDGGAVFSDGGYWGAVYTTGLTANSSCISFPTGFGNDGGLVTVRTQSLLLNRQGMDTWNLGHYNDGGPPWAYAVAEFQAYPAVLVDGGVDLAQTVNLQQPPGMWVNPDGVNNGDFLQMGSPLNPQCQVTFVGDVGTPNSVPFPCACAPLVGSCSVAVSDGGWGPGVPDLTYGVGAWQNDAGCERKSCFELAGVGPTSMQPGCYLPDGGF